MTLPIALQTDEEGKEVTATLQMVDYADLLPLRHHPNRVADGVRSI